MSGELLYNSKKILIILGWELYQSFWVPNIQGEDKPGFMFLYQYDDIFESDFFTAMQVIHVTQHPFNSLSQDEKKIARDMCINCWNDTLITNEQLFVHQDLKGTDFANIAAYRLYLSDKKIVGWKINNIINYSLLGVVYVNHNIDFTTTNFQ